MTTPSPFKQAMGEYIAACAQFIADSELAAARFRECGETAVGDATQQVADSLNGNICAWYVAHGGSTSAWHEVLRIARTVGT